MTNRFSGHETLYFSKDSIDDTPNTAEQRLNDCTCRNCLLPDWPKKDYLLPLWLASFFNAADPGSKEKLGQRRSYIASVVGMTLATNVGSTFIL